MHAGALADRQGFLAKCVLTSDSLRSKKHARDHAHLLSVAHDPLYDHGASFVEAQQGRVACDVEGTTARTARDLFERMGDTDNLVASADRSPYEDGAHPDARESKPAQPCVLSCVEVRKGGVLHVYNDDPVPTLRAQRKDDCGSAPSRLPKGETSTVMASTRRRISDAMQNDGLDYFHELETAQVTRAHAGGEHGFSKLIHQLAGHPEGVARELHANGADRGRGLGALTMEQRVRGLGVNPTIAEAKALLHGERRGQLSINYFLDNGTARRAYVAASALHIEKNNPTQT
eukprot:GEMP01070589.1.p1 GENE.GEMP01070589.1~~GEMP01070589.1.p1  ORF type:complete len:289 (+),score=78.22 GEMP01070589.1:151-1017(+)